MNSSLSPTPPRRDALRLAQRALLGVQHGSRTGDWSGLVGLVADDVTFWTPTPGFDDGLNRGRERLVELTAAHRRATSTETILRRTLANGNEIAFEVRVEGRLNAGRPYANQLFLVFAVEGEQVVHLRWQSAAPAGFDTPAEGRGAFDGLLPDTASGDPPGGADTVRIEPSSAADLAAAREILGHLQSGANRGGWAPLLDCVRDDFSMWVPVPGLYGFHQGPEAAQRLFSHHSGETRTTLTPMRLHANGNEFAYELRAEGQIGGQTYSNQLIMVLVVEDGGLKQFREYCAKHGGWAALDVAREAWEPRALAAR